MSATDPIAPEQHHSSIRLPQPVWIGLATVVLSIVGMVTLADDQHGAPKRQNVSRDTTILHPFCRNGKWGYIDNHGRILIEPHFDYTGPFTEGLAPARKGEVAGYVRTDGSWQIELPKQISPTRSFREGRVAFLDGDKFGFLDRDGNVAVPAAYDHVTDFRDGRAGVLFGYGRLVWGDEPPRGQWGFIDPAGKLVIPTGVGFGSEFSEGLAPVCSGIRLWISGINGRFQNGEQAAQPVTIENPGCEFIDRDGKLALTVNPDLGSSQAFVSKVGKFSEGLLAVNGTVLEKRGTRPVAGFVDKTGKTVIRFDFEWAGNFSEGMAAVERARKWGFINRQGTWSVCPSFDEADEFHEGFARVRTGTNWQFVDHHGCVVSSTDRDPSRKPVAASPWNDANRFDGGLALVHVGGQKNCDVPHQPCYWEHGAWYYVNLHGAIVSLAWRDDVQASAWRRSN